MDTEMEKAFKDTSQTSVRQNNTNILDDISYSGFSIDTDNKCKMIPVYSAKITNLKREKRELYSQYATRIVQIFIIIITCITYIHGVNGPIQVSRSPSLQRLHPANAYPDEVKHSDSIKKLLEVLPVHDEKEIKIGESVTNTSQNVTEVLMQILTYNETETMEDIEKEHKTRSGIGGVNNAQNASVKKLL